MRTVRTSRPVVERDVVAEDAVVHSDVERAPWSPAQFVALAIGMALAVIGGVAMARAGLDFSDTTQTHVKVAGLDHTAWLGMIELVIGLVLIGAGALPGAGRGLMTFMGVLLLGFGMIVLIQPSSFHSSLGAHSGNGVFFTVMGVLLLLSAMLAPVFFGTDRRTVAHRSGVAGGRWQ